MLRVILILAAVLTVVTGCGGDDDEVADDGRVDVVASFYPLAWAAEGAGGETVDVRDLTPPGAEPHDLELAPDDVDRIEDADLVIVMGGGFQPAVERAAARREGPTLVVRDELDIDDDDPHLWLDPATMDAIVVAITEALAGLDEAHGQAIRDRGAELEEQLGLLDEEMQTGLTGCARTTIVTAHDAFGWLARRFGLTQEAIAGLSPHQEPDPKRLSTLADLVASQGVTTVFTETLVSPAVAEALAREVGVDTAVLDPLESRPKQGDYLDGMRANLTALRKALACP